MDQEHLRCARTALERIPPSHRKVTAKELVSQQNGHVFHQGMHIGWAWGEVDGKWCLDFLHEHRIWGMYATRFFPDGSSEQLEIPHTFYVFTGDSETDKLAKQEFFEQNRRAYESLRELGLLPPVGENFDSQDMNEFLTSGLVEDSMNAEST